MSGCAVTIEDVPCEDPGDMYVLGCVHEHVGEREICTRHARMMAGNGYCVQCAESRNPHECDILLHRTDARNGETFPGMVTEMAGS